MDGKGGGALLSLNGGSCGRGCRGRGLLSYTAYGVPAVLVVVALRVDVAIATAQVQVVRAVTIARRRRPVAPDRTLTVRTGAVAVATERETGVISACVGSGKGAVSVGIVAVCSGTTPSYVENCEVISGVNGTAFW